MFSSGVVSINRPVFVFVLRLQTALNTDGSKQHTCFTLCLGDRLTMS